MSAAAELRPPLPQTADLRRIESSGGDFEFDLLLACCADLSERERISRLRSILLRPLDWTQLLRLADHHGVIPQVYSKLSLLPELLPPQIISLRSRYQEIARKNLWFTGELVRVLKHLESLGIEAMPHKGPALSEILYGDVTQRQFGDLDILIHPADVGRIRAAMSDLGYHTALRLTRKQEQAYIGEGYEYSFVGTHGRSLLEVQWQILPRFYSVAFDAAGFFERAEAVVLGGHRFRTLGAQDLLLTLCVHAAKHVWVQLSWLCDIAQLARSERLDWEAILAEAERLGIMRILALNFLLAHQLLGSAVPHPIEAWLREDATTTTLAEEILGILRRSSVYDTESISYFRLMMRLRERWQDRARFLWHLAITPGVGEWSAVRLADPFFRLYRVVRIYRLAGRLAASC